MASWQDSLTSTAKRLSNISQTGNISDVTFVVGEGKEEKRYKLHKLILSMTSDVFFTMFYGSLPEKDEVRVIDIQPDIFETAIKYIYEDSFPVQSMEQAMKTHTVAEKYNIAHLRTLCINYMIDNLCPGNIPILYTMPNLLHNLLLKSKCKTMLSERTSDVLKSDNFVKSPLDMVKDILQLDQLNISGEVELFNFVIKWAQPISPVQNADNSKKASLRYAMEKLLPQIRFLAMSIEEFFTGPVSIGILTDSEIASISENLVIPGRRELPHWCNKSKSRNFMGFFQLIGNHVCIFDSYSTAEYSCSITIKRGSMTLRGFSLFALRQGFHFTNKDCFARPGISIDNVFITPEQAQYSYDRQTCELNITLLKPVRLSSLNKAYRIYVCHSEYKFRCCKLPPFGNNFRRHGKVEFNWYREERRIHNDQLIFGVSQNGFNYPHFHEIYAEFP